MNEIGVVFTAEFMRKIRSRIFMVATLVGVVAIMILLAAPSFLTKLERSSTDGLVLAGAPAIRDRVATLLARRHAFQILERVEALPAAVTPEYLDAHHPAAAAIGEPGLTPHELRH
ncbi:MAG: hypothetical protein GIX03_11375, partial [Candidatus Eremiobacteraeota bacterium]|nr:hypothetical protein [Candidatus Eremiobacteraeota bacterium]